MERQIKMAIAILLAVCFILSITAAAVSADQAEYDRGYKDGNDAGYKAGIQNCKQDQPLTPKHDVGGAGGNGGAGGIGGGPGIGASITTSDYDRGYQIGYNAGFQNGYSACGANPVADFSASPTSGKAPLKVTFTDQSTGNPATWKWDFGDGQTSIEQNPTHTYASAGTYTVKLTVQNKTGSDSITKFDYINARQ